MKNISAISLGAGVQSSTMLLMAARGDLERPDVAIFADTQWEPQAVYSHLEWLEQEVGKTIPIIRVTAGNLRKEALKSSSLGSNRFFPIPLYLRNQDGKSGMLRRRCTRDFKIVPIRRKLREMVGNRGRAEMWIGISLEEAAWRMRMSDVQWIVNRYPLVEKMMTRHDCFQYLKRHGYPIPPKSSCIGCPYHSNEIWRHFKDNDPVSWQDAVEFDNAVRKVRHIDAPIFLHESLVPLSEVDLTTIEDKGQLNLFNNECEGMCGV